jgi:hypothetical protein
MPEDELQRIAKSWKMTYIGQTTPELARPRDINVINY